MNTLEKGAEIMTKKSSAFMKEFRTFINRGNVLDMAIGVVLGGSFGKIVTGLVNYIINPLVSVFTGGADLSGSLVTVLVPEEFDPVSGAVTKEAVKILWGDWLQTILDFLIISLFIFLTVRFINRAKRIAQTEQLKKEAEKARLDAAEVEKKAQEEEAKAKAAEERKLLLENSLLAQEKLLTEIRDSIQKGR